MNAIDQLYADHDLVLEALEALVATADDPGTPSAHRESDLGTLLDFFSVFLDRAHHAKEERALFPALAEVGFSYNGGPIAVMLEEHERGRALTAALADPAVRADASRLASTAHAYASLLRGHISKENEVLFRLARSRLAPLRVAALTEEFATIEKQALAPRTREELAAGLRRIRARSPLRSNLT